MDGKFKRIYYYSRLLNIVVFSPLVFVFLLIIVSCNTNILNKNREPRVKKDVYLEDENVGGLTRQEVLKKIQEHASKIDVAAKDAIMEPSSWGIFEGKPGLKVNIGKTLENVLNAEEGQKVELVLERVYPNITNQHLQSNIVEIASYSTPIVDKSESRMNNIKIAAEKINNKILQTGEEFSFNRVVGRRTEDKGYEYAPIIIKTEDGHKKKDGIGGGVCQLSTTLYNAVEECGLEVTERHTHSSDVTYVPEGEDATVSYGSIDLKFINTRKYPIMIKVYVEGEELIVKILENRNFEPGS
ncbi:MAG: VanW family protein [Firmicutes bacterium]|nr:VanW family protein [Bacillota bacterium]